jgi:ATP-dependent DNA ligase
VRFAGIVRKGFTPKQSEELLAALKPLTQPKSYIPGLKMTAIWVKPEVFCEIEHRDFDRDQHFISPQFKAILSGK